MIKSKHTFILAMVLVAGVLRSQSAAPMDLRDAIKRGIEMSLTLNAEKTGVEIAKSHRNTVKDARLPDISTSAQFLFLPVAPKLNLKTSSNAEPGNGPSETPIPHYVAFGSLTVTQPIFTGYKLKNSLVQANKSIELSEISVGMKAEDVAWQIVNLYASLFKTEETRRSIVNNLAKSNQRITDLTNFLNNGLLSENDLLKAKLQRSNIQMSLDELDNSASNLKFRLNTMLKRDLDAPFDINISVLSVLANPNEAVTIDNRKDLALLDKKIELAKVGVDLSKAAYYPSLAVTGGYIGANVQNVLSVSNAINLGIGLKYNIAALYKNKAEVSTAQLQQLQVEQNLKAATENANIELSGARKNYELMVKKQSIYDEAIVQANENLRIITNKNQNGLADTDQVLEADLQQLQAEINQKVGKVDQQLAWYQLLYTSGNLIDNLQIQK